MLRPAKTLLTIAITIAITIIITTEVLMAIATAKPELVVTKIKLQHNSLQYIKDHQRQIDIARIAEASLDATGDTSPSLFDVCNETELLPDNAYGNAIIESCMRLEL